MVGSFARHLDRYGLREVAADAFYRESIAEHLAEHRLGIVDLPAGRAGKVTQYTLSQSPLHEGRVDLPGRGAERLRRQLSEIASTPTSGGGFIIRAPRRAGHEDQARAFVEALCHASMAQPFYLPEPTEAGRRRLGGGRTGGF